MRPWTGRTSTTIDLPAIATSRLMLSRWGCYIMKISTLFMGVDKYVNERSGWLLPNCQHDRLYRFTNTMPTETVAAYHFWEDYS
jgi:hypothetical protein